MTVAIVDCGISNVDSVARAVEECGGRARLTGDPDELAGAAAIVLPGVGAFPEAMRRLRERGFDEAIREQAAGQGIPTLGICLGMQLLADASEEHSETEGLGLIAGRVVRLEPAAADERVPHVGWNEVHPEGDPPILRDVEPGKDFYFVHSFRFAPDDEADVLARTPYCGGFASVVGRERVWGTQFHPEKSQKAGFALLRSFLSTC